MELRKAYKFELDPNNRVRTLLAKHAGTARFAWNWSLHRRIERFQTQEGKEKFTNAIAEHREVNARKGPDFPWMYEVSKCAPQEALRDLDKAFKAFWSRRSEGVGFPKFKKKHKSKDSFRLYGSIEPQTRYIKLPKLGTIRTKEKINGRVSGKILSATVSRVADRWFVSVNTVEVVTDPMPIQGPKAGVDLGILSFATVSSDGACTKVHAPNPLKQAQSRLRRTQRSHSRKRKGSSNRRKSAQRIARIHSRVANVRRDFLHKFTTGLAKTKSAIVVEDLGIRGMSKNPHLSRSILDQGWFECKRQLVYKTTWYGSKLEVVDRWFPSSKICSRCGLKRPQLALSVREWTCEGCGAIHDRDENAAKNLERYSEFPRNPGAFGAKKPVESPLAAERRKLRSTSHDSLKQEVNIGVGFC
jgi:putative transposase